jgi:hypothetical protein
MLKVLTGLPDGVIGFETEGGSTSRTTATS